MKTAELYMKDGSRILLSWAKHGEDDFLIQIGGRKKYALSFCCCIYNPILVHVRTRSKKHGTYWKVVENLATKVVFANGAEYYFEGKTNEID